MSLPRRVQSKVATPEGLHDGRPAVVLTNSARVALASAWSIAVDNNHTMAHLSTQTVPLSASDIFLIRAAVLWNSSSEQEKQHYFIPGTVVKGTERQRKKANSQTSSPRRAGCVSVGVPIIAHCVVAVVVEATTTDCQQSVWCSVKVGQCVVGKEETRSLPMIKRSTDGDGGFLLCFCCIMTTRHAGQCPANALPLKDPLIISPHHRW